MAAPYAGPSGPSREVENATVTGVEHDAIEKHSLKDSFSSAEKGEFVDVTAVDSRDDDDVAPPILSHLEQFPIDPRAEEETQQLTFRAVIVGCALGAVISASNIYLGLKTGWTFGSSLFGAIFGFAILKPLSRILPKYLGGGYFGPKENVCLQSAATSAGSLGLLFSSGFPAAYQLGLLNTPAKDFGKLVTFTLACAFYGMIFALPLRKLYILRFKLTFPTATAAAVTIHSLHHGKDAEKNARRKTYALFIVFWISIIWKCVSEYAPGMLWTWNYGWTLYRLGWSQAIKLQNMGWALEFTPAFIGVGLLTGRNASYSFFLGSLIAWGVIAPSLASSGAAFGEPISPKYPGYINWMNMVLKDPINHPSPRYWLVWPGTMLLLAGSFAEMAAQFRTIYAGLITVLSPLIRKLRRNRDIKVNEEDMIEEPCTPDELVPTWMWSSLLLVAIVFSCLVLGLQFHENVGVTILALVFAFIFSFIGAESAGRTNINPVTSCGNASQLVIGGVTHGHGSVQSQQLLNLSGGLLAVGAAYQSVDMLYDLKTTHLLRAAPRVQFYAQCAGAIVSVFMSVGMYVLFSAAYPCINDLALADTCAFSVPDVAAFRAVAVAVTSTSLPVPPSSAYFSLALLIYAFVHTFVKYRFIPTKYHCYIPNLVAIAIAFILNTQVYSTAMAFGATVAHFWGVYAPQSFANYSYAIAAGGISGEGIGGVIGAALTIAGVAGSDKGTAIGCPAFQYCG